MMKSLVLIGIFILSVSLIQTVVPEKSVAALTYTRVSVEGVDTAVPSLTFTTAEGEVWTLAALSADMLQGLRKGDTCSVELDLDNHVTKIVKIDPSAP